MPKREIVKYIKSELKKGFHISDIKSSLYKAGHHVDHVEGAVDEVYNHHAHMHTAIVLVIVFILVLSVSLGFVVYGRSQPVQLDFTGAPAPSAVINEVAAQPIVSSSEQPVSPAERMRAFDEVFAMVKSSDDVTLCQGLKDAISRNECEDNYYLFKNYQTNDRSFCQNIRDPEILSDCIGEA